MSKNNKHKLIPKLRFPEFQNEGEWEVKKLGEICEINNGKANAQDHIENGRYPLFDRSEVIKASNEFIFDTEAVIIPGEGMRFIPKYYKGKFNLHQRAYALNNFKCFGKFIYYSILNKSTILSHKAVQSTVLSLRLPILQNLNIELPKSLIEQEKIASCLSSLDEVITGEQQKLELLKQHKKGLLQNLFPQEGETVPKLRFKEFENSGEWVVKKLGEIAHFLKGKGISKADVDSKGKLPCIRYGELYTHYGEIIKEIKSFTNLREDDLMLSEPNDVIIPSSGETKEDIATASCVKLGGVALGGDLNILRTSLNGDFLAYYLSNGLKKVISKIAQGDAVVHLYATQLKKLTIGVPSMKEEQEKIASCLSSLDEVITAQTQKIEQLQRHKKGLLQGLFPNINNE
jgi:type I restriction enzyme S subunit